MKKEILIGFFLSLILITGCVATTLKITDAKMAKNVDAEKQPVGVTTTFSSYEKEIHCWFSYTGAPPNTVIKGSWYLEGQLLTDSVVELKDSSGFGYHFRIRRTTEKPLPIGNYRVDLSIGSKVLKSIPFTVTE